VTDLELFLAFYKSAGIELRPAEDFEGDNIVLRFGKDEFGDNAIVNSDKFDGYIGFYSDAEFTKDGVFVRQGFWE